MTRNEQDKDNKSQREYETTGLYVKHGKSFRVLALLGVIVAVIIGLAGLSALIDILVDY